MPQQDARVTCTFYRDGRTCTHHECIQAAGLAAPFIPAWRRRAAQGLGVDKDLRGAK